MSPPGTYFVTFSTWQRRRLFVVERYARLSLKTMYVYRRQGKFQLHTFVLMPEHVHVLLTPAEGVTLERVVRLVKGGYSYAFGMEFGKQKEVWQRRFTDHRIRDRADFEKHRGYIHDNPVAHRLGRWNIATARRTQGSSWTACPQRLKPQLRKARIGTSGTRALSVLTAATPLPEAGPAFPSYLKSWRVNFMRNAGGRALRSPAQPTEG